MNYCAVVTPEFIPYVKYRPCNLVLAQDVMKDPEPYKELQGSGRLLILDNGANEGILPPLETYQTLISEFKPNVAVLPDCINDGPITTWMHEAFLNSALPDGVQFMAVLQSRFDSVKDYMQQYLHWATDNRVSWIGFSKHMHITGVKQPRALIAELLLNTGNWERKKYHHVLGIRKNKDGVRDWSEVRRLRDLNMFDTIDSKWIMSELDIPTALQSMDDLCTLK